MTIDFRALCAELLEAYEIELDELRFDNRLAKRARAALTEPEPEGPTDEEIMKLMPQQMRDDLAAAARALAGFDPDNIKAASVFRIILNRHSVDHARAVLARWGRPAPQPVPVSERLPGPGDCDAEGRCWWGVFQDDELLMRAWHFERQGAVWRFACWLPAHALPLPK